MAHFDYIKPGGVWPLLSLLSSAIMAEIDKRIYKSINGDEGGVWAPTPTAIIIGGLGLRVTGPFEAANADITITSGKFLTVESGGTVDCQVGSIVNIAGTTTISGPVDLTSTSAVSSACDIELTDGELRITHPATFVIDATTILSTSRTFLVSGGSAVGIANTGIVTWQSGALANYQGGSTTTFALGSSLTINGALTQGSSSVWTLNGTSDLGSSSVFTAASGATMTIACLPTFSGGMEVGYKSTKTNTFQEHLRYYEAPNANTFINAQYDVIKIVGDLGTHKTYQIANPLFSVGSTECLIKYVYRVKGTDGSDAIIVRADIGSTTICTLKGGSNPKGAILIYEGSNSKWELLGHFGLAGTDITIP